MQCSIPSTIKFNKIAQAFRPRTILRIKLADFISVARVRPRTSKGITAVTRVRPRETDAGEASAFGPNPSPPGRPGGASTYLKPGFGARPTPLRALRRLRRKGARHRIGLASIGLGFPCTRLSCVVNRLLAVPCPKIGASSARANARH